MVGGLYFLHPTHNRKDMFTSVLDLWTTTCTTTYYICYENRNWKRETICITQFRSIDQKQSKSKTMTNGEDCSSDAIREGLLGPTSDEAVSSIFIQRASNSCCRVSLAAA